MLIDGIIIALEPAIIKILINNKYKNKLNLLCL